MIITFPFIDRSETANHKTGVNKWKLSQNRQGLKFKCNYCVRNHLKRLDVNTKFYGAVLNRYWYFKDARQRDYDNFCSGTKYYTDALVAEELIEKDDCNHLLMGAVVFFDNQPEEKLVYKLDLFETKKEFNEHKEEQNNVARKALEAEQGW